MKTKIILSLFVIIITIILLNTQRAAAQVYSPPDSCLKMIVPNQGGNGYYENPDSVKVDSCLDSPTFGKIYTKKYFSFYTPNKYIFTIIPLPNDTIVGWEAIDNKYIKTKQEFEEMGKIYGKFYIKRFDTPIDSVHLKYPIFYLWFDRNNMVDSIVIVGNRIDNITEVTLESKWGTVSVKEIKNNKYDFNINPNPANENIIIDITDKDILSYSELNLINYLGIIIKKFNNNNQKIIINIQNLPNGIYFIKINNIIKPFIIMR
ncbi:MAG: T9SS type A sorting domain-containing protein [FCB group bacterium]|jgi:hypothetical protein